MSNLCCWKSDACVWEDRDLNPGRGELQLAQDQKNFQSVSGRHQTK